MRLALRRLGANQQGTTLVEFALVAPVLILVLVASLDFARALNAYVTIANASREGARYAAVHPDADRAQIESIVAARAAPLDARGLMVWVTYDDGSPRKSWPQWPSAGLPPSPAAPKEIRIQVEARYQWHASCWLIGSLFSMTTGSRTFESASMMATIR
jgi:Flp pilus assembly pilin Flp